MKLVDVERAVRMGGLELPSGVKFVVVGQDPILASPHYLGNGAAVTRLLTGLAANELWRMRTGRSQDVEVDARHAAAALRSYLHTHPVGQPALGAAAVARGTLLVTRIVAARDGRYVQLHGSFRDGPTILSELGLDDSSTAEQVDAAVAGRDAFELEAALIARKVCGGVVRSKAEWAKHPQGRCLAGRPVVTITKIGDAPPEPLPDGDRPASGVRIVDLTRVLAGPTCAKTIAEHGADVLHITAPHLEGASLFELETGHRKAPGRDGPQRGRAGRNHARLDPGRRHVLSGLPARDAGPRGGSPPEQVAALRPGIVYVSENCYGHEGPWSERPGLGAAGPGGDRHVLPRRAVRTRRRAPAGAGRGQRLQHRLPRRLWRHDGPGAPSSGGRVVARTGVAQPDLYLVPGARRRQRPGAARSSMPTIRPTWRTIHGPDGYRRFRSHPVPDAGAADVGDSPRWDLPPARPGAHEPAWLPR